MATTPLDDTTALDQITDAFAVDGPWNGGDICEAVANIIGATERPHPGVDQPRAEYREAFQAVTGRELPDLAELDGETEWP